MLRGNTNVGSHGDVAAVNAPATLSFCLWMQNDSSTTCPGLTKGNQFLIYASSANNIAGGFSGVWEYATSDGSFTANVLRHVAVVYDGSLAAANRWKIWLDGVAKTLSGTTPGTTLNNNAGSNLEVFRNTTVATDGILGDLKMWTTVLTEADIQLEMRSFKPVRLDGLVIWAPYMTNMLDYSFGGNGGSITGATALGVVPTSLDQAKFLQRLASRRSPTFGRRSSFRQLGALVPSYHLIG